MPFFNFLYLSEAITTLPLFTEPHNVCQISTLPHGTMVLYGITARTTETVLRVFDNVPLSVH